MFDTKLRGALGFDIRKLMKVVSESVNGSTIVASPKRGLADRDTAHASERFVVVGGSRHHVKVWIDVVHGRFQYGVWSAFVMQCKTGALASQN